MAVVALFLGGGAWHIALFRIEDGLDPQVARLLFHLGNYTFSTSWVMFDTLALSVEAASLWLNAFPRLFGWTALAVGVWLITEPIYWTSPVAFVPYVLFWVWLVSLSVVMFRRCGA